MSEVSFGDLYSYQTKNGVVLPITNDVKEKVEEAFKGFFGEDFSVNPSTPQGRMIEAITLLFCDVLRVCAVNANGFNPYQAVGAYLDNIGAIFGVARIEGETDSNFRQRIIESNAKGVGYAESVRSAISRIEGVTSVCVLDNGNPETTVLPNTENGISISPHSIFVCVGGGSDLDIANAIFNNLSAGCGMESSTEFGDPTSITITDDDTGTSKDIKFYHPQSLTVTVNATVRDDVYTGTNIIENTQTAISTFVRNHSTNYTITKGDLISAIGASGSGIICTELTLKVDNVEVDKIIIRPYMAATIEESGIEVTVI